MIIINAYTILEQDGGRSPPKIEKMLGKNELFSAKGKGANRSYVLAHIGGGGQG